MKRFPTNTGVVHILATLLGTPGSRCAPTVTWPPSARARAPLQGRRCTVDGDAAALQTLAARSGCGRSGCLSTVSNLPARSDLSNLSLSDGNSNDSNLKFLNSGIKDD